MRPWLCLLLSGCRRDNDTGPSPAETGATETGAAATDSGPRLRTVAVTVTLDGEPAEGVIVRQGGGDSQWLTGADGTVRITTDSAIEGDQMVIASHPEARILGVDVEDAVTIALTRFDTVDNEAFVFQDPGEPDRQDSTTQCAHCHVTINADWYVPPHKTAASNPVLHDLYAGTAAVYADQTSCEDAGGNWWSGLGPGTGAAAQRCYLGEGTLPALNEDCGDTSPCDGVAQNTGACADCHAPGIDGVVGGRDLLEATDFAYDFGVHCDVCHRVESVDLEQPAGVAGRLQILRPSEKSASAGLGTWQPLTFGPYHDVINPRMGSVQRDHFSEARLCAGCHQLDQEVLVAGQSIDTARWPEGTLPIHSTYDEWLAGPFADAAPCQSCHMPPDPDAGNSSDVDQMPSSVVGVAGGWRREPGQVRRHTWTGPRSDVAEVLPLAASLTGSTRIEDDALIAEVTVTNVGPGHALPTGEPLRSMLLLVQAQCGEDALPVIGGDVVPDFGGYLDRKVAGEDWSVWPGASAGQRIRVVQQTGDWLDYTGTGPFGDGRFSAEEKGMPAEQYAGEASIVAVAEDGTVTLDAPLPAGAVAYRVDGAGIPEEDAAAVGFAGAAGFGFARVLTGPDGARMVPHFLAVDVASDNRLLPQTGWTSTHRFSADCDSPTVTAALLYRPWPLPLAAERGWSMTETIMAEVTL